MEQKCLQNFTHVVWKFVIYGRDELKKRESYWFALYSYVIMAVVFIFSLLQCILQQVFYLLTIIFLDQIQIPERVWWRILQPTNDLVKAEDLLLLLLLSYYGIYLVVIQKLPLIKLSKDFYFFCVHSVHFEP